MLQRKNFRCPRDGSGVSPLKGTQRKRVHVGATNLFRSISSPELQSHEDDVSAAAHHVGETNVALVKASMHETRRPTTRTRSTSLVVLSEKRRLEAFPATAPNASSNDSAISNTTTTAPPADADLEDQHNHHHPPLHAPDDAAAEHAFFLATRHKLFDAFVDRYGSVRAVFKAFDRDGNGFISSQRFADMVAASEVELSPTDVARVFRHVDANGDNSIAYQEFSEMFTASEYVAHASAYSPSKLTAVTVDPTSSLALKFRAPLDLSPRTRERMKQLRLKVNGELLHKHGRDVSVHGGKTENLLIYAFKQFDGDNDGLLSYDQVKRALGKDYLQLDMSDSELNDMVRLIDRNGDEQISMKEFVQYFGAGERELPTDLIDNGRRKALAALHYKANVALSPRDAFPPPPSVDVTDEEAPVAIDASSRGCLQENLASRIAASPAFRHRPPRAQTSPAVSLMASASTPDLLVPKRERGPTLTPLVAVSQDRHAYWRDQRTDWTRVGVGGDGVRADAALFASDRERLQTTTTRSFSPMRRGVHSGDVSRDDPSTSESEAAARAARRHARFARTQNLLDDMANERVREARVADWQMRAKVRLGAARQFEYLERVHDQEQRVAMREQQMAKRHGGARFHRMWAGSAESQFNNTHVTEDLFSQ